MEQTGGVGTRLRGAGTGMGGHQAKRTLANPSERGKQFCSLGVSKWECVTLCLINFSRGFIFFMRKCKYKLIVNGSDFQMTDIQMRCLNPVLYGKKATPAHLWVVVGTVLQETHMDDSSEGTAQWPSLLS